MLRVGGGAGRGGAGRPTMRGEQASEDATTRRGADDNGKSDERVPSIDGMNESGMCVNNNT